MKPVQERFSALLTQKKKALRRELPDVPPIWDLRMADLSYRIKSGTLNSLRLSMLQSCIFAQYWTHPLCVNDRIISFPLVTPYNHNKTAECVHSFNLKTGILEPIKELKYPSYFVCNPDCTFAYKANTSEILVGTHLMSIHKINLINKKWSICNAPTTQFICGLFENWMFVKNNQVHVVCTFIEGTPQSRSLSINSLKHLIFDESDSSYTVIGTSREEEFIKHGWDKHIVLPGQANKVYLLHNETMKLTEFVGDTIKHTKYPDQDLFGACNGAVITSDNKIVLVFEEWLTPNCPFINIIDIEKGVIRKSAIRSPSMHAYICGQHQPKAIIVENANEVLLTVNGYHRQLTTENKLIPTLPVQMVQLIQMFYCKEQIFFLNVGQEKFCYAVLYLDEILNSTDQDERIINFEYNTSR